MYGIQIIKFMCPNCLDKILRDKKKIDDRCPYLNLLYNSRKTNKSSPVYQHFITNIYSVHFFD